MYVFWEIESYFEN
jgi:hypothetical protein